MTKPKSDDRDKWNLVHIVNTHAELRAMLEGNMKATIVDSVVSPHIPALSIGYKLDGVEYDLIVRRSKS